MFAEAFRRDFIGPRAAINQAIFDRASARGEIRPDIDLDILVPALPGIILHRMFLLGEPPTQEVITAVIDQVILPAATPRLTPQPTKEST